MFSEDGDAEAVAGDMWRSGLRGYVPASSPGRIESGVEAHRGLRRSQSTGVGDT